MFNLVGSAVGALFRIFQAEQTANQIHALFNLTSGLARTLGSLTQVWINVLSAEKDAWKDAPHRADETAQGIGDTAYNQMIMWQHLIWTILPQTLSWEQGYVVTHWIDPIRAQIASLQAQVAALMRWRTAIDSWRHEFVDPMLTLWVGFRQWFYQWPIGVLETWHGWFQRPTEFATWATPPLIGPIISYLGQREHQATRDDLVQLVVDALPDRWRHVEAAALTILEQDYP